MRLLYLNRSRVLVCLLATEALVRRRRIRFGSHTWRYHMGLAIHMFAEARPQAIRALLEPDLK